MKIYWMFLILSLLIWVWSARRYRVVEAGNHLEDRGLVLQGLIFFGIIIFFCGLRSGIADTGTYISMFDGWPNSIGAVNWDETGMEKGFTFLTVLYKQLISTDFHGWLFLIALISGIALMAGFLKYSASFGFSCFLLIATTMFTYFVNGMRQWIVVVILFCFTDLIADRKFFRYVIVVLLLSTIHTSALIMIPFYFLSRIKPWSGMMWVLMVVMLGFGVLFDRMKPLVEFLLSGSDYENYIDLMTGGGVGSNIFRLAIAAVPVIISFFARERISEVGNRIIYICVNMSVVNLCLYFLATVSSGMAVGRLTTYFDIYNMLLLPWLIKYAFTDVSRKIVTILCVFFYIIFFYYQMVVTWHIGYESDILHLFLQ